MECCMLVNKNRAKGGKRNYIKYIIWLPMVAAVLTLLFFNGIKKIEFFYQTQYGISVSEPRAYVIYYSVVFLALILALTVGKRGFCHYVCWTAPFMILGSKIRNIFGWRSLHLEADNSQCTHCQICSKVCPVSLDVKEMIQKGSMVNDECILCGECVESCPKSVIKYSFKKITTSRGSSYHDSDENSDKNSDYHC